MSGMEDEELTEELSAAAIKASDAHRRLAKTPPGSPHYQEAMNAYLQATVLYMSIVSVAQARQYEALSAELTELRAMVGHPTDRPVLVH
jgi:hypothetical protein